MEIREHIPSANDYNLLRESVGWHVVDPTAAQEALRASLFCVCSIDGGGVIGMARVVGDGKLYFHGQDLIVHPAFQGRGIGKQLIEAVLDYLKRTMTKDSGASIIAATGKSALYEKFGFFSARADGPAMFWAPAEWD